MKISHKSIIIFSVAAVIAAASCTYDETIRYNSAAIGTPSGQCFRSDIGTVLNVEEYRCPERIDTMDRAYIVYDVLRKSRNNDGYDIRIRQAEMVAVRTPLAESGAAADELQAEDPVDVRCLWLSGGYINMVARIHTIKDSGRKHLLNLVFDDGGTQDGKYVFTIRHNAAGETIDEAGPEGFCMKTVFLSFPVSEMLPGDETAVRIRWKWYKKAGEGSISSEIEDNSLDCIYRKNVQDKIPCIQ